MPRALKATTKETKKVAKKVTKKISPKTVSKAATKATPKAVSKVTPKAVSKTTTKTITKSSTKPAVKKAASTVDRNWSWLLGLGILFVVFGFLGLSSVVGVTLISIVFIGFMFLVGGVLQLVDASRSRQWQPAVWHGLIAIMYFVGGCFVIWDPVLASTVITALIGWTLVVIGIIRLMMAVSLHGKQGWFFTLVASLAAIILGGIILMQWPLSSLWVIGMFISIELLLNGLSYVIMALAMRTQLNK